MLTLNNILSTVNSREDFFSPIQSKVQACLPINWKSFKRARSQSPKEHYNIKFFKIPDSKIELMQKAQSKPSKSPILDKKHSNKEQQTKQNVSFAIKIQDNTTDHTPPEIEEHFGTDNGTLNSFLPKDLLFNDEEIVEEHPLYALKLPKIMDRSFQAPNQENTKRSNALKSKTWLTPKQITKENQIKLFHLTKLLEEQKNGPSQKAALICNKILDVLEENPDFFVEIPLKFPQMLKKFLFCDQDKLYDILSKYPSFKNLKKPQTYPCLIELLLEEINDLAAHNQNILEIKQQEIIEIKNKKKALEEELSTLNSSYMNSSKKMNALRDTVERQLRDQLECLQKENAGFKQELQCSKQEISVLKEEKNKMEHDFSLKFDYMNEEKIKERESYEREIENKDIKFQQLLDSIHQTKDNYHNSIICLKTMREKLKRTEEKLSQAQNEISRLSIRAAAHFSELTPRPSLENFMTLLAENKPDIKGKSTIESTQIIYEKLKQVISNKSRPAKRESNALLSPRKMNPPKKQTIFSPNQNSFLLLPQTFQKAISPRKKSFRVDSNEDLSCEDSQTPKNDFSGTELKSHNPSFNEVLPSKKKL